MRRSGKEQGEVTLVARGESTMTGIDLPRGSVDAGGALRTDLRDRVRFERGDDEEGEEPPGCARSHGGSQWPRPRVIG